MVSVEEFKAESKNFRERSRVWEEAYDKTIYSIEKLDKDFEKIILNAERLLLD